VNWLGHAAVSSDGHASGAPAVGENVIALWHTKKSKKSVLDNLNLNYIYAHQVGPASLSLDGHDASASAPTLP
jgi:hypothetical protein